MYRTITDEDGNQYRLTIEPNANDILIVTLTYKKALTEAFKTIFEAQKENVFDIWGAIVDEAG